MERPRCSPALPSAAIGPNHWDPRQASPGKRASTADGTLVLVTLYGGNDALNTVVPIADDTYRAARGPLALDPAETLDIGEGFALHPALTRTKALWDADQLAVVHGVGFESLDRSHFHCMDVWQAGGDASASTGWVGRWLDLGGDDPLDAVSVGRRLPLLARGERRAAAVIPPGPFTLPGDGHLRGHLADLADPDRAASDLEAVVARSTADLLAVADTVGPLLDETTAETTADAGGEAADTFVGRMAAVARLIEAELPTRVYEVELGGFDTHANQLATHEALLAELDEGLGTLLDKAGELPITVLVYSEFGRRVAPNAGGGTDHGAAGTVLVAGDVRPGHHGDPPPLDHLTDGDLVTTVDYRAVYGAVLEGVLGVETGAVLDDPPAPLELV